MSKIKFRATVSIGEGLWPYRTVTLESTDGCAFHERIDRQEYNVTLECIEPETESEFRERMKRQALWTDPERYPMGADQPAQIDCRREDCRFYQGAGECSNVAPAITLNPQKTYVCWSHEDRYPDLKPCVRCHDKAYLKNKIATGEWMVQCGRCGLRTNDYSRRHEAIDEWEWRAP